MSCCSFAYSSHLVSLVYVFCFFFFKQKTAYEMRISDWSSDVCSSDLDLAEMIRIELNASPELVVTTELPPRMTLIKRPTLERQGSLLQFEPAIGIAEEIGRESCRERVCQYV